MGRSEVRRLLLPGHSAPGSATQWCHAGGIARPGWRPNRDASRRSPGCRRPLGRPSERSDSFNRSRCTTATDRACALRLQVGETPVAHRVQEPGSRLPSLRSRLHGPSTRASRARGTRARAAGVASTLPLSPPDSWRSLHVCQGKQASWRKLGESRCGLTGHRPVGPRQGALAAHAQVHHALRGPAPGGRSTLRSAHRTICHATDQAKTPGLHRRLRRHDVRDTCRCSSRPDVVPAGRRLGARRARERHVRRWLVEQRATALSAARRRRPQANRGHLRQGRGEADRRDSRPLESHRAFRARPSTKCRHGGRRSVPAPSTCASIA